MSKVVRRELRLPDGRGGAVSGILLAPASGAWKPGVLLAHGAGGNLDTPVLRHVARRLAEEGRPCLRHNFPYSEAGRRRPDFPRALQSTILEAARFLAGETGTERVVVGGKSLGGRMSSMLLADGALEACGLVLLGYPLHPSGRREELRDAHLGRVPCPVLFVQGTRDPFADLALMRRTVDTLLRAGMNVTLHVVEGGEHSFKVPSRSGRTYDEVLEEVSTVVSDWAGGLPG